MNEIKNLFLLELRSFYGINQFRFSKDQKYKSRYKKMSIIWIFLIAMVFTYVGGLSFGLCSLGLSDIVPAYLTVLSSAFIVFFGMFTTGNRIFSLKGYDILASMPIKSRSIVISRFLSHYIADLVLTAAIMLPGIAVYGYCVRPNIVFYLLSFLGSLFIPAIPLALATVLGTVIMAVSSRMKRKSAVQSLLSVLLVLGVMTISFSMEGLTKNLTAEEFKNLAETLNKVFGNIYPPAVWLNSAIIEADILKLLLFVIISVAITLLTAFVVSKSFNSIARRLGNFSAKHNYKISKMEHKSLVKSLLSREAKRYFSSSIYVTNTIIGPILATVMSVAVCVIGIDEITASILLEIDAAAILPFVFSAVFSMMTTTSVSISMEGKQFWIIKSLPITSKALFDSKILLNLCLMLPFYIVSQIALAIAVKPTVLELLWMLLIPACIMIFATVFGITVNLKFHSFDWVKEETVVKQSAASAIGGFVGLFTSIVLGALTFVFPANFSEILKAAICIALISVTFILYRANNKKRLIDL